MRRSFRLSSRTRRFGASLAALICALLLMGVTPLPSPAIARPAVVPPPASQLPVPTGPLFPAASLDPLSQASGGGGTVSPPPEIVGTWYEGSTSSVGYVDPNSGSYSDGGSEGLSYAFLPDGSWQSGYLITSALYACEMRVMVFNEGTLTTANPVTHMLQLHADRSQMHSEDTCDAAGNYDRELPTADEIVVWQRITDDYGDVLMLRHPETGYSAFRPMGQ